MTDSPLTNAQVAYFDTLRGGAAQFVLLGHIYSFANPDETLGIGDLGVVIFFILSGFLITYSALTKMARGSYYFGNFFRDRFFRIFVPYLSVLVIVLAIDTLVFRYTSVTSNLEYYNIKDFVATLTMLQQHPFGLFADKLLGMEEIKLSTFGSARPWWTVANEWWLYMTFGLILFARNIASGQYFGYLVLLAAVSIVPLFNMVAGTGQGLSLVWFLMAGIAWIYVSWGSDIQDRFNRWGYSNVNAKWIMSIILGVLIGLSLVRVIWTSYIETGFRFERPYFYDFNLYFVLVVAFTLMFLYLGSVRSRQMHPVARFIANYSYSLYLVHYSLLHALTAFGYLDRNRPLSLIVAYVLCNVLAIVAYALFERHYKSVQRSYEAWRGLKG